MTTAYDLHQQRCREALQVDCLEDTCGGMYPAYWRRDGERLLVSTSATVLATGPVRDALPFDRGANFMEGGETWFPDVHRLGLFSRVSPGGEQHVLPDEHSPCETQAGYVALQAIHIRQNIQAIEARFPDHRHVVLTGGRDSLLIHLVEKLRPDQWSAFTGEPNVEIVREFFARNGIACELETDDGQDRDTPDTIDRKILATDGLCGPAHIRWMPALQSIAERQRGQVVFWSGQHGDILNAGTYAGRKRCELVRRARHQGMSSQAVLHMTGCRMLSCYHSPELWRQVYRRVDLEQLVGHGDLRPMLARQLAGGDVWLPDRNPGPPPYSRQQLSAGQLRARYLAAREAACPS